MERTTPSHTGPRPGPDVDGRPDPGPQAVAVGPAGGGPTPAAPPGAGGTGTPVGRRVVLGLLGAGAVGVVFGGRIQQGVSQVLSPLRATALGGLVPGAGGFTLYTVTSGYPAPPPEYRVAVTGMVDRPLRLSVADLQAMPATRLTATFQCVTGWEVGGVHWVGVRLSDLVRSAGVRPGATACHFTSFDGVYTETLTLTQAQQAGALVAYSMLGAPITRQHGGPVRLYVPGMFGYKSIKWLSGIQLVDRVHEGYWEQRGYPVNAWIAGHPPTRG